MIKVDRNKISIPGEYNLDVLTLKSYNGFSVDLRPNLIELTIHENIYHPALSGQLMIAENVNLAKHFPLIGNETLEVEFNTPSRETKCKRTFFVYKIDDRIDMSETAKLAVYTLYFTTPEAIANQQTRISRAYKNMKYSSMVTSLYYDYLMNPDDPRPINVEPTLGKKSYVIPYSKPFAAMAAIAKRSISNDVKDTTYLFYETFDGYQFSSINYLAKITNKPIQTYFEFQANLSIGAAIKDVEKDFARIESWQFVSSNNTLESMANGVFAGHLTLVDTTKKQITEKNYGYHPDFFKQTTLEKGAAIPFAGDQFSSRSMSHYRTLPNTSYQYDNVPNMPEYENVVLQRNAHLRQFGIFSIEIAVPGDSERRVGDIVQVNLFSGEVSKQGNTNVYDSYSSGRYLVSEIIHMIQKKRYSMKMILQKDSVTEPYPEKKTVV